MRISRLMLILSLLMLLSSLAYAGDDYIAYWRFENNGNDEGGAHNGTVQGSPNYNSSCKYGGCYEFDGVNDYINVTDSADFVTGTLTITAWYLTIDNYAYQPIVSKGFPVNHLNGGMFWVKDGKQQFFTSNSTAFEAIDSTYSVRNGQWHFGVFSINSTMAKHWVDNDLKATDTTPISWTWSDNELRIGRGGVGYKGTDYFNGSIDELRIYNRTLTAQEMQNLYLYNDLCIPSWYCSSYYCSENNTDSCIAVADTNSCAENYTGNYSEFTLSCEYCALQENEDLPVCYSYKNYQEGKMLPEKIMFMLAFLTMLGMIILKLYNIMHKGAVHDFIKGLIFYVISWLAYAAGFMLYLTMPEELGILVLYNAMPWLLKLITMLWVIELILLFYQEYKEEKAPRAAYFANRQDKRL